MKILVALSGGVDSSVVAHLLKEQGHELVGVMMKLWTDPLAPDVRRSLPSKCCSLEHIARARHVAQSLDIPFYVVNFDDAFKTHVVDPFLESYQKGDTPNPCIACNRTIKFGALLDQAKELGCDALATGHYARVVREETADGPGTYSLLQAVDTQKDQSYYLYTLTQEKLRKILFPLGGMQKEDVYALAERYGVPIPETYHESQDLCFFPEKHPKQFLKRYLGETPSGDILSEDGEKLGEHEGLPFYTIGQRKGLKIGGQRIPLHVTRKEPESNRIYVAPRGKDLQKSLTATDLHWISWVPQTKTTVPVQARVHSLGRKEDATIQHDGQTATISFTNPLRGIAPGQSVVLYRNEEVVGGGRITGAQ